MWVVNVFFRFILMKIRAAISIVLLGGVLGLIGCIFWKQQAVYLLPTPKPHDYQEIALGTKPALVWDHTTIGNSKRPTFLHFYNPDCPCSRFNLTQFKDMVRSYQDSVDFYVILQPSDRRNEEVRHRFEVPVIRDEDGKIADAYGVYATPQALILDQDGKIYYRGNYNKARYCTSRDTRFAELALQAIVNDQILPPMVKAASISYGCALPSDRKLTLTIF